MPRIQVESIVFARNDAEDIDGYVIYLITKPCMDSPCRHICATHFEMSHHYERQPFRRGVFGHRKGATAEEIAKDYANVWGWDDNVEAPTLLPSFLCDRTDPAKYNGLGYRLHSYLKGGRLELCGDSTVEMDPNPAPCRDRDGWENL